MKSIVPKLFPKWQAIAGQVEPNRHATALYQTAKGKIAIAYRETPWANAKMTLVTPIANHEGQRSTRPRSTKPWWPKTVEKEFA